MGLILKKIGPSFAHFERVYIPTDRWNAVASLLPFLYGFNLISFHEIWARLIEFYWPPDDMVIPGFTGTYPIATNEYLHGENHPLQPYAWIRPTRPKGLKTDRWGPAPSPPPPRWFRHDASFSHWKGCPGLVTEKNHSWVLARIEELIEIPCWARVGWNVFKGNHFLYLVWLHSILKESRLLVELDWFYNAFLCEFNLIIYEILWEIVQFPTVKPKWMHYWSVFRMLPVSIDFSGCALDTWYFIDKLWLVFIFKSCVLHLLSFRVA